MNDGSSGSINVIVREEAVQPLRINWNGKQKEVEFMQVAGHISSMVCFSTTDREGIETPYDDALVVEAIIHNFKVQ